MDYLKCNQAVILTAAVIPDAVSLLRQINTARWIWCSAIDLENAFVCIKICKYHRQQDQPNRFNSASSQSCVRVMSTLPLSALIWYSKIMVAKA